ncbi:TolC family outer membrane protein [Gammaproteobacteria bacterium]|nr:TolC family outer membrane protein [Gammaproteobacteria bacterium]
MKTKILFLIVLLFTTTSNAENLLDIYKDAINNDPIYKQNIAKTYAISEGVKISLSSLLPSINGTVNPYLLKQHSSGSGAIFIGDKSTRGYNFVLSATQTIFNFAQISNFAKARATAKQASANLNYASQDLITRVTKNYFQILEDVDNLRSAESTKKAFAKQLDQAEQQFKVGVKTITNVYTAQASYEESSAALIAAMNKLENDRENLRVITGKMYKSLSKLGNKFPLITPKPSNIDDWTKISTQQNWQVKAAQLAVTAAKENIHQQLAGHFPTINAEGNYIVNFSRDMGTSVKDLINPPGPAHLTTPRIALNLQVPIIQGGRVLAETRQAKDNYQATYQELEQTVRNTVNKTRQSYLNVISGIQKIKADKKAIQSSKSSLEGMKEGYKVGTEILVNVLNQQRQVFINERIYAADRYAYINNIILLKQAAGTLAPGDIYSLNSWLGKDIILNKEFPEAVRKMIEQKNKKIKNNQGLRFLH